MKVVLIMIFNSAVIGSVILHVHFYIIVQTGLGCCETREAKLTSIINVVKTTASPVYAEHRRNPL